MRVTEIYVAQLLLQKRARDEMERMEADLLAQSLAKVETLLKWIEGRPTSPRLLHATHLLNKLLGKPELTAREVDGLLDEHAPLMEAALRAESNGQHASKKVAMVVPGAVHGTEPAAGVRA